MFTTAITLFGLIFTAFVSPTIQLKNKDKKCTYSCENYIKILQDNSTLDVQHKYSVEATHTYVMTDIKIAIMSRQKYWLIVEKSFGDKPSSYGLKHLIPDKEEATLWFKNKKCKIRTLCPPNGDCWGSSSTVCLSDQTNNWVSERSFQFKGIQWSTAFHDACTLDWEWKYIEKKTPIHYDSDGARFIVIDDFKLDINSNEQHQLHNFPNYAVYIDKIPREIQTSMPLSCFKHKKSLLCEDADGASWRRSCLKRELNVQCWGTANTA